MTKKILILTASPVRDILIDEMLAKHLRSMGNKVWVKPCLRQGRDAVLELKPDVVLLPPIRNMYSRDFAEELKRWKVGVITRHTEPSCDWTDFKNMSPKQKGEIWGNMPYVVDMEIVWSEDEAQILTKRGCPFPVFAVGSFSADKYLNKDYQKKYKNRSRFNKKHNFSKDKKTILIQSPWGFADHAPDLRIDEIDDFKRDTAGRDRHLDMIEKLHSSLKDKFNILITVHPGVLTEPYKERLDKLKIPLDNESTSLELLINSDILIHAGSTVAMGAHFLDIPAFQFGDVNLKDSENWWSASSKIMSEISPKFEDVELLAQAIKKSPIKDNINLESLKYLEKGRYGKMDGKATERAAQLINKVEGRFEMCWPRSVRDYSQLMILKHPNKIVNRADCGICKEPFWLVSNEWLTMLGNVVGKENIEKMKPKYGTCCPNCGSKFMPPNQ